MVLKQNVGIDVSMEEFEANLSVLDKDFEKNVWEKRSLPMILKVLKSCWNGWAKKGECN